MSQGNARPKPSQAKSSPPAQEQFYANLNAILGSEAAQRIGKRIDLLSQAVLVPGHTDTNGAAALLNMDPRGVRELGERNNLPVLKPGKERIYAIADLVQKFAKGGGK